jgi:hypothetical protein
MNPFDFIHDLNEDILAKEGEREVPELFIQKYSHYQCSSLMMNVTAEGAGFQIELLKESEKYSRQYFQKLYVENSQKFLGSDAHLDYQNF